MSLDWLVRLVAFSLVIPAGSPVRAQQAAPPAQDALLSWQKVPPRESGLVLIIDGNVSFVELQDVKKDVLDTAKWDPALPFIRQYRLEPGTYDLRLAEPISGIGVNAKAGSLTYVRLAPYRPRADIVGIRITGWVGSATPDIPGLLTQAYSKGLKDAFITPRIDVPAKTLYVNTYPPPWSIPPQPQPPPPRR
jgi:hypothetical protein